MVQNKKPKYGIEQKNSSTNDAAQAVDTPRYLTMQP